VCWSCQRRPAAAGSAARIKLEKTLGYRPTLLPLGIVKDYLKLTVRVPMCRRCGPVWRVRGAFDTVIGCSGCLIVTCLIVGAIAVGLRFLLLVAPGVLVLATVIGGSLRLYERSIRPDGSLRNPATHPDVVAARKQHGYR
jgi:hypothetical protein